MSLQDFALGFLVGFLVAAALAYRRQVREHQRAFQAFQNVKTEAFRILDSVRDLTEVKITIRDETGDLELKTEETPKPKNGLH